jgi:hypothetical protein
MSKVHYFQRYSQKENVVTNNTLLLFSRLYADNPHRFQSLLSDLLADAGIEIDVGPAFAQQTGTCTGRSTPDGAISQRSFRVLIETKLYDNADKTQLLRHIDGFAGEENQVLLLINPNAPAQDFVDDVQQAIDSQKGSVGRVRFFATTFERICDAFQSTLADHDVEMQLMATDYREFCDLEGLLPRSHLIMRAITAGTTFDENERYGVYYDPVERGFSGHAYLGLYRWKSVRSVGKITRVVHAELDPDSDELTLFGEIDPQNPRAGVRTNPDDLSAEDSARIKAIIATARKHGWDVTHGHNFFLVDKFVQTNFRKTTKYPIQRAKIFNLADELEVAELPDTTVIARELAKRTWG